MNRNIFKTVVISVLTLALSISLCACGGGKSSVKIPEYDSLADGTYTGRSSDFEADESGNGAGYGEVTIEVKDGKIASCEFSLYELDGTLKDESYGSDLSQENRLKAQKAVQSASKYASKLVESGSLSDVDTISGATISYNEFLEAVVDALDKAAQ